MSSHLESKAALPAVGRRRRTPTRAAPRARKQFAAAGHGQGCAALRGGWQLAARGRSWAVVIEEPSGGLIFGDHCEHRAEDNGNGHGHESVGETVPRCCFGL